MVRGLQSGMSPTESDSIQRTQTAIENMPLESHLLQHSRLRRLGPLDEEQVEVGPLLGRGSFGRVYKGVICSCSNPISFLIMRCLK